MLFVLVKVPCLQQGEDETVKSLLAGRLIGGSCDVISHSVILLPLLPPSGVQSDAVVCVLLSRTALIDFSLSDGWLAGFASQQFITFTVNVLLSTWMC